VVDLPEPDSPTIPSVWPDAHLADLAAQHHALGQLVRLDQVGDPDDDGRVGVGVDRDRFGGDAVDLGGSSPGHVIGADARRRVIGTDFDERWFRGAALVDHQRAARRERAPGWQRGQRRGCARDRHQASALWGVEPGHGAEKSCGVGHSAVPIERLHRRDLDRAAGIHHLRPVGELGDDAEIVRDDQHACAGDVAGGLEHVEDLRLHGDVQRGGRLVADQQVRVVGDGDRDDDPLPFPAGQFVRE